MTVRVVEHDGEFDPGDPYDAMCENFRLQVVDMILNAERIAIYRDMDVQQQISAFMGGALTGIIGVCFACIIEEGRDEMIQGLINAIPFARQQAEGILDSALKTADRKQGE